MSSLRGLWITNKHQHCIENHFVTVELKKVSQVLEKSTQSAQSAWSARSAVCMVCVLGWPISSSEWIRNFSIFLMKVLVRFETGFSTRKIKVGVSAVDVVALLQCRERDFFILNKHNDWFTWRKDSTFEHMVWRSGGKAYVLVEWSLGVTGGRKEQ